MAVVRTAQAHWEGSLMEGQGEVELVSSEAGSFEVNWPARADEPNGKTSPEELIAAAHSTCFSMALSHGLAGGGHAPTSIDTTADVTFQVVGDVPGITAEEFEQAAQEAKENCPVSQALKAVPTTLEVSFKG